MTMIEAKTITVPVIDTYKVELHEPSMTDQARIRVWKNNGHVAWFAPNNIKHELRVTNMPEPVAKEILRVAMEYQQSPIKVECAAYLMASESQDPTATNYTFRVTDKAAQIELKRAFTFKHSDALQLRVDSIPKD